MVWGSNTSNEPLLTLFAANALVARSRASPGSRFLQIVDNFISSFPKTSGTVKTLKKATHQVLSSAIQMRGGEKSYGAPPRTCKMASS
jgi:hypothetical protein